MIFIGCCVLLAGVLTFTLPSSEQGFGLIGLGLAISGLGAVPGATAELLAKHRMRDAGLLKILAIILIAASLSVLVAGLWLYPR